MFRSPPTPRPLCRPQACRSPWSSAPSLARKMSCCVSQPHMKPPRNAASCHPPSAPCQIAVSDSHPRNRRPPAPCLAFGSSRYMQYVTCDIEHLRPSFDLSRELTTRYTVPGVAEACPSGAIRTAVLGRLVIALAGIIFFAAMNKGARNDRHGDYGGPRRGLP